MTRLGIALRLLVLVPAILVMVPLQWLVLRLGIGSPGRVPVLFHRLFLRLFGIRVHVRGEAPQGAPTLVLANHVSWLDIAVIGSLLPLSFIAKAEVAGWPVFGLFARLQRTIFVDRTRKTATAAVNASVAERLSRGDVMVLFAEGTTGDGNRLLPFRSSLVGAARAALAEPALAEIRLQPLALVYSHRNGLPVTRRERPEIAWYGDMEMVPHLMQALRAGPVDVTVAWGAPIPFDDTSNRKAATLHAEAAVRAAILSIRQGAPPS